MKKNKIIQVIPSLNMGGAEIMCENLSYELKRQNNEVIILSLYNNHTPITERMEKKGIKIVYLNKNKGFDLKLLYKIRKFIKEEKPDIIHTHLYSLKYVCLSLFFKKNIKIIHTVHNIATKESTKKDQKLNKFIFKKNIAIPVALSEEIQDTICELYDMNKNMVPIVYNGINLNNCIEKNNYHIGDKIIITHVGRFFEQKNHKGLILSFHEILKTYNNCELRLIGNGALLNEIKELVKSLGIDKNVKFLGEQKEVYQFLNESDIFIMPSLYEGVPLALIEAMGTGLPIIVSNVGGIKDMVENNIDAILIKPNIEEIYNAFNLLINDYMLRKKIGKSAKRRSIEFSVENMEQKYSKIYNK